MTAPIQTAEQLANCPFCNCAITHDIDCDGGDYETGQREWANVTFDGPHSPNCPIGRCIDPPEYDLNSMTLEQAFAAWNTRADTTAEAVRRATTQQDEKWRGICKLVEESGEVLQLVGKIMAYPEGEHPDGKGDLKARIQDEVADLTAALDYFSHHNLDEEVVGWRAGAKREMFERWVMSGLRLLQSDGKDKT